MEGEKKKKNARPRIGTFTFTGLWTAAYALGWGLPLAAVLMIASIIPELFDGFSVFALAVGFVAIPGIIISVAQHLLIRIRTGQAIQRWWLWSSLGWLLGGIIFYLLTDTAFSSLLSTFASPVVLAMVGFSMVFLPHTIIQSALLRKRVQRPWLWPLAALASAALFILPQFAGFGLGNIFTAAFLFGMGGLLQGWTMGVVLLWLFGMSAASPAKEKAAQGQQDRLEAYGSLTGSPPVYDADEVAFEEEAQIAASPRQMPRRR